MPPRENVALAGLPGPPAEIRAADTPPPPAPTLGPPHAPEWIRSPPQSGFLCPIPCWVSLLHPFLLEDPGHHWPVGCPLSPIIASSSRWKPQGTYGIRNFQGWGSAVCLLEGNFSDSLHRPLRTVLCWGRGWGRGGVSGSLNCQPGLGRKRKGS